MKQIRVELNNVKDKITFLKRRLATDTKILDDHVKAGIVALEAKLNESLNELMAAIDAVDTSTCAEPVIDPPVIVDPPVIIDPPAPPVSEFEPSPDFSQAPFKHLMPAFPQYKIPTQADCHWIIEAGVCRSTRGLASIAQANDGGVCGTAYRASIAAGHTLPITFGVVDDAGPAHLGGFYYHTSPTALTNSNGSGGWEPVKAQFIGLTDTAEVGLQWCGTTGGQEWGRTEFVGAFNIGLRGIANQFGINANKPHGTAILDGCWFLNPKGQETTQRYNAAITVAHGHTLVIRRCKSRGKRPTDPCPLYQQHNYYLKNTGPGGYWILENQLQGSNGTCFQIRPGTDEPTPVMPSGPVVVAYNQSNGYGFEWGNTAATEHGGAAITIWSNPNHPIFVYKNRILDARYACFVVSQQGAVPGAPYGTVAAPPGSDRNFYGVDGYPVHDVYVADNEFSNPRSGRQPVSISGCKSAHIWASNKLLNGQWYLNSQWAAQHGYRDIKIGTVRLYAGQMQGENFWTWDGSQNRKMTEAELSPLRRRVLE